MPVGVPKVPYQIRGDEEASWVDIYNRLYRQGFLFIVQEIDSEISNQIVGLMVFLSLEGVIKDLYFFICSPGGSIVPGFAIYDMMIYLPPTMHTLSLGESASMASLILAGGTFTQRIAFPHTRIMIHQPRVSPFQIPTGESLVEALEFYELRNLVARVYAKRTGQPLWVVEKDLERDVFMTAQEAKDYGIVDLVASSESE
uniref:ATP-dependent Clp protease proteolytic subunit n=3 Tax=Symphoricarpos TaxID=13701 RepID=A0A7S8WTJ1_9DIPS|nr:ATP-dependent Clp protease proteolytic subunit [Symphoricarpos orbiculatus]YP_010044171.1 ATP-dependent Clp protease proteolytic subunit [Symphoricarpos sinensis]AKZ21849.1 ATP-dependent Clp protease proteolytic subunit [Symphoricarpos occidentalis]QJA14263.1 ATP-dependent Clp protease proteolytic subunit [Symphoricarpos orbiculatus]QPF22810.1 ATP-dependent Clp protease proteolytic subunit [Symphoricarpos sinensis]URQ21432.1 clp protease proteolytic subunit [Symphoricarpos orbiculatus]